MGIFTDTARSMLHAGAASLAASTAPGTGHGTERQGRLAELDALYHGEHYHRRGLAPPWDKAPDGQRTPLRRQRPAVQFDLARVIVNRVAALLFGEGRFPDLGFKVDGAGQDDQAGAPIAAWLSDLADEGSLPARALAFARIGAALGSGVMTWSIVEGRVEFQPHKAAHCQPTFDPTTRRLVQLDKRYQFRREVVETVRGAAVRLERDFVHRELWTPDRHVVFVDVPATSAEPSWVVASEVVHGFGFVPGVWCKAIDDCEPGEIDGASVLDGLPTLLEDLDRVLTGAARGIRYNTEPEKVYTGLPLDPTTRQAVAPPVVAVGGGATTSLPAGADAKLIEIGGTSFQVAAAHVDAQRARALEVARVVLPDPDRLLAAASSGAALRTLFAPTLELVGELRQTMGHDGLRLVLEQLVDAARAGKLTAANMATPPPATVPPGRVTLSWGAYFEPTPADLQTLAQTAATLHQGGILDLESVLRWLGSDFGVNDPTEIVKRLATGLGAGAPPPGRTPAPEAEDDQAEAADQADEGDQAADDGG